MLSLIITTIQWITVTLQPFIVQACFTNLFQKKNYKIKSLLIAHALTSKQNSIQRQQQQNDEKKKKKCNNIIKIQ
jgi:hypothetical protein